MVIEIINGITKISSSENKILHRIGEEDRFNITEVWLSNSDKVDLWEEIDPIPEQEPKEDPEMPEINNPGHGRINR